MKTRGHDNEFTVHCTSIDPELPGGKSYVCHITLQRTIEDVIASRKLKQVAL